MGILQDFSGDSLSINANDGQVLIFVDTVTAPGTIPFQLWFNPDKNTEVRIYIDDVEDTTTWDTTGATNSLAISNPDSTIRMEINNGEDYDPDADYGHIEFLQIVYDQGYQVVTSFNEDFLNNTFNETYDYVTTDGSATYDLINDMFVTTISSAGTISIETAEKDIFFADKTLYLNFTGSASGIGSLFTPTPPFSYCLIEFIPTAGGKVLILDLFGSIPFDCAYEDPTIKVVCLAAGEHTVSLNDYADWIGSAGYIYIYIGVISA